MNALKYGALPVTVSGSSSGGWVEVAVADGGEGVPEGSLPQLFEPFTRAWEDAAEGSGLGLSVVRGLAEANGGGVRYEQNGGACFRVRLPAEASVRAAVAAAAR